jgi:hypothetical protein
VTVEEETAELSAYGREVTPGTVLNIRRVTARLVFGGSSDGSAGAYECLERLQLQPLPLLASPAKSLRTLRSLAYQALS